ncbi:hypothetical protein OAC89_03155 [Deltaproteobacteria bacterium]|nr:hypothetical protein [Deltaproteobacteria bacterium]
MENDQTGKEKRETFRRWIAVVIFAMAFAWVESAIVVYLREIFYQGSFYFPIVINWEKAEYVGHYLTPIEMGRELATIVMLAAVAWASGKNGWQKFSFFMIAFGIWDIFYYIWLWVMVGWPESLMTWDILFLLPLPWVGPVITPVLIALAMIGAGTLIIYYDEKGHNIQFFWYDWTIVLGCGLLMIVAFCWDWKNIIRLPGAVEHSGIPNPFLWELYLPAYIFSVVYFAFRLYKNISHSR